VKSTPEGPIARAKAGVHRFACADYSSSLLLYRSIESCAVCQCRNLTVKDWRCPHLRRGTGVRPRRGQTFSHVEYGERDGFEHKPLGANRHVHTSDLRTGVHDCSGGGRAWGIGFGDHVVLRSSRWTAGLYLSVRSVLRLSPELLLRDAQYDLQRERPNHQNRRGARVWAGPRLTLPGRPEFIPTRRRGLRGGSLSPRCPWPTRLLPLSVAGSRTCYVEGGRHERHKEAPGPVHGWGL
jgi:hypothetical protein